MPACRRKMSILSKCRRRTCRLHFTPRRWMRFQAASRSWVKPSSMGTAACFGSRKMSGRISFRVCSRSMNKFYYNQNPRLLTFVLSKPPDRVKYTNLALRKPDFEEIEKLGREAGILSGRAHFEDYTDASFVTDDTRVEPYAWEPSEDEEHGR